MKSQILLIMSIFPFINGAFGTSDFTSQDPQFERMLRSCRANGP
jgi:hypothetical protein